MCAKSFHFTSLQMYESHLNFYRHRIIIFKFYTLITNNRNIWSKLRPNSSNHSQRGKKAYTNKYYKYKVWLKYLVSYKRKRCTVAQEAFSAAKYK